jgi:Tol biopolymer transport system component
LIGVSQQGDYFYSASSVAREFYTVEVNPVTGAAASQPKRQPTRYDSSIHGAAWSPDGTQLAYLSVRETAPVLVLRSPSTGQERVVVLSGLPKNASIRDLPIWSPDGGSLVARVSRAIYRVAVQSGEASPLIELKEPPFNTQIYHARLRLSPDGRTVFYTSLDQSTQMTRLIRQSLDGGSSTELYRGGNIIGGPSLSPDGATLVFSTSSGFGTKDEYWSVMTMPANGGDAKLVCRVNDHVLDPIWSRDGRRIFFATYNNPPRADKKADIWSVPAEGGQPKALGLGLHWEFFLDLSPDGRQLSFTDENWNNDLWAMRNLFPTPAKSE